MSTLLAIKGPRTGARYSLEEHTTIGRSQECTIELPDNEVSRVHAEIILQRKSHLIRDLDSKNGTFVNNKPVKEHALLPNDEIRICSSVFIFEPDFDIQNARFSGSSVYVAAPLDETIEIKMDAKTDTEPPLDDKGIALVRQLTDLLTQTSHELPALLPSLLLRLVRLFHADRGFIMLWDPVLRELQPVVTVSPQESQIAVSRKVINTTFFEKTALLASGEEGDYSPYAEGKGEAVPRSSISAPLFFEGEALGLVYIDRSGADHYDLRSLGLLQSIARLIAHSIQQSRYMEKILLKTDQRLDGELIGNTPSIKDLRVEIDRLASFDTSIMIVGETGTGKELVARGLHENGARRDYPFVVVNCTAVPETLFESELFGYERGAFTGATRLHRGKIEIAHGGTLFLDEIGDLSPALQPKLLRFLQEKNFYRIGGTKPIRVDVRVIAATNSDLKALVSSGEFREDLYYRLSVVTLRMPPLRERKEDVRLIAEHYVKFYSERMKKSVFGISDDALVFLEKYPWPGNIRELMNAIERAVILCTGKIIKPEHLTLEPVAVRIAHEEDATVKSLAEVEKEHIMRVLKKCEGNRVQAAKILRIHRNTLHKKLLEYHLV